MMVADEDRPPRSQPLQACLTCKVRKKKCDKSLPTCDYCTRKGLNCVYTAPITDSFQAPQPPQRLVPPRIVLNANVLDKTPVESYRRQVYSEVYRIIRSTGQFVDDVSARYFQGFHRHLPIISRTSFYESLTTLETVPNADFSILLLTIALLAQVPALGYEAPDDAANDTTDQQSLYLSTKSLFTQVQASCPASVPLVQAGVMLSVFEYMNSQPDNAFLTITCSARMAYAARIHMRYNHHTQISNNTDTGQLLEAEEAANTWWGIVIYERIIFSEIATFEQPLLSGFPAGDERLPIEPKFLDHLDILDPGSLPNISVSCLRSPALGGFGRTAQATGFLDQVRKCFDLGDIDSKLLLLDRLDNDIQSFLLLVLPQCLDHLGAYCSSTHTAFRALFTIHWYILDQLQVAKPRFRSSEEWGKKSHNALDTVTRMVVDIAGSLTTSSSNDSKGCIANAMPPQFQYITRAALRHLHSRGRKDGPDAFKNAETVLQAALDKYTERWTYSLVKQPHK